MLPLATIYKHRPGNDVNIVFAHVILLLIVIQQICMNLYVCKRQLATTYVAA